MSVRDTSTASHEPSFLTGGGDMGRLIRAHDWTATPLGAPTTWPQSLRSALGICLNSSFPTAIYWGPELRLFYNDAWAPIPGERHPWALGRPAEEVWGDIWSVVGPQFAAVIATGDGFSTFDQMLPFVRDGAPRETYWNYSFTPIRGESGAVEGVFNQGHETTDRILSERDRAAQAARQRQMFRQAPGFITILGGPDHVLEFVNDSFQRLFGDRDFDGKTVREAFPDLAGQGFYELLDQVYTTGERFIAERTPVTLNFQGVTSDRVLDFIYEPMIDEGGQITGIFCEGFDVTEAYRAQQATDEQSRRLETLNQIGRAMAGELDLERLLQMIIDAGVELIGAQFGAFLHDAPGDHAEPLQRPTLSGAGGSDLAGMNWPRAMAAFGSTLQTGGDAVRSADTVTDPRFVNDGRHSGRPGVISSARSYLAVPVAARSGEAVGGLVFGHPEADRFGEQHEQLILGLAAQAGIAIDNARLFQSVQDAKDTLERRVAERSAELTQAHDALRQAQKMEAVGQLTGGIAHDFNNLLAGISGSLEIIERRLGQGQTTGLDRFIEGAQTSARRAAALTQRLLAFSRRQTLDPRPTDVNRLVFGMEDLIRRTVGPGITVEVVGAGGLWLTRVDAAQLESALLNLAINARDAMPQGGRLTIETANKWLDDRAGPERDLPPGQYLSICVTDTGTGIAPDIAERIFDPFFTTKPIGQGTGLGLSMIHGFVRQSGGQVRVYSEPGEGTTMCLYLPRHIGELDQEPTRGDDAIVETGTGQTVLVVDDDATVRMLIVEVLHEAGFATIEAEDGPAGLRVVETDARIDLLITDVGLPGGLNGRQVADHARAMRPDLKVLFVTGYAENAVVGNGHLEAGMEVITKPFAMTDLANKIADMIDH